VDCITWQTVFVSIQNTLLETIPPPLEKTTLGGYRKLDEVQYIQLLKKWRQKKIGGYEEISDRCDKRLWHPPENGLLYGLYCAMSAETRESAEYRYYLLITKDRNVFLKRKVGKESSLSTIALESADPVITQTLESIFKELKKISISIL
jgi:hypothetical protein